MHRQLFATFIILLSSLTYSQEKGASAADERWFQIELFIYANNDTNASENEQWQQFSDLSYPATSQLLSSQLAEQSLTTEQGNANVNPAGLTLKQDVLQSPAILPATLDPKLPFTLLPKEELQLGYAARRILAQADFRPLFHGAWRQVVASRKDANPIVITGGDQFDDHFELEGTITLGVNRYLHIETDLWLSTFSYNSGLTDSTWQPLPKRPKAIPIETIEHTIPTQKPEQSPESISSSEIDGVSQSNNQLSNDQSSDNAVNGTALNSSARSENIEVNSINSLAIQSSAGFETSRRNQRKLSEGELMEFFGSRYSVESTAVVRQKRRMRSNELHYIDHPSMGLLIKITPYELTEEIEAENHPQLSINPSADQSID